MPKGLKCPWCGRRRALLKDGTFGNHFKDGKPCPGAHRPPRDYCKHDPYCTHEPNVDGYYFPCDECYEAEGRPPRPCRECEFGSVPFWTSDWGWVHADEGAPSPMPCPDKIA